VDIPRELAKLIRESPCLRDLLDRAVELVARRMEADVCSIYTGRQK
jgi:signal transduction protein with GAF and PtsI domain